MKTCPKCHRDFSDSFDTCPHDETALVSKPLERSAEPVADEPEPYYTSKMVARSPTPDRTPRAEPEPASQPEPTRRLRKEAPEPVAAREETRSLGSAANRVRRATPPPEAVAPEKAWTQYLPWVITCICLCVTVYALVYASKAH